MRTARVAGSCLGAAMLLAAATGHPAVAGEEGQAQPAEREFTLGLVQKELRVGMSQTDVVTALGSPNLVTRGKEGRESWVYDKVATEARVRSSEAVAGIDGLGTPGTSLILGVIGGRVRDNKTVTMQRTLTVVIRFGFDGVVEAFSFHASRF
jgi:hypothetical protein